MRGGRVAIAAVTAVLLGLAPASSAYACSCAPEAPGEALAAADGAIVGHLLKVEPHGATQALYRFEVMRVYRGRGAIDKGAVLTVWSPRGSAACALPDRLDRNYGLLLLGDGRRWASGLCGVLSPRRLWAAAQKPGAGQASSSAGFSCTS